jgi:peptidoglycan/LPS O-acetylase OafA/YrhL
LPTIIIFIGVAPLFRFTSTVAGVNQVAIWVLTPGACDALCLGAFLAYLNSHEDELLISKEKVLYFFLLTGLFITLVLPILPYLNTQNLVVSVLADTGRGLIFACLVAAAANGFKSFVGKVLESRPMVYLGKISYGIYLIHAFMPDMVYRIFDCFGLSDYNSPLTVAFCSTVATIIVATITWHFLERPINDLKRFFQYTVKVHQPAVS